MADLRKGAYAPPKRHPLAPVRRAREAQQDGAFALPQEASPFPVEVDHRANHQRHGHRHGRYHHQEPHHRG